MFQYLKYNSQGVSIWDKMTTPSNQMEADLSTFDQNYQWGSRQGELGRPAGAPNGGGLRALYCYFMDTLLRTIETNAHTWQTNAPTPSRPSGAARPAPGRHATSSTTR